MTSTYTRAALRSSQLRDNRATPMTVPRTVASTMPMSDTRSVLTRPMTRASRTGWRWRKSLSGMGNDAGLSR